MTAGSGYRPAPISTCSRRACARSNRDCRWFVRQIPAFPPSSIRQGVPSHGSVSATKACWTTGCRPHLRRIMLGMSQEKLGEALGLTFQQVQKYEKGTNRVGASRIQQISEILQVPVSFLFEGGPSGTPNAEGFSEGSSPAYISDFLAT